MGMTVVAFGLLGLGLVVFVFGGLKKPEALLVVLVWALLCCFIARVGGGIFTKAADVGLT